MTAAAVFDSTRRRMAAGLTEASATKLVVAADRVVKRYGAKEVLVSVSLTVGRGEVLGLLGPNGAGKTTLVETLVGLRKPDAGAVRVLGLDPAADRARVVRHVGFQPQSASLFPRLTVRETLTLWARFFDAPRAPADAATLTGTDHVLDTQLRRLTRGQRQRALLAIALVGRPDLVILDEPSDGLDPAARQQLWAAIAAERDRGATVVLTTHSMDEAEALCDRVVVLDHGRVLASDTPAALVNRATARQTISFRVPGRPCAVRLRALPAVVESSTRAHGAGAVVELETTDATATIRGLASGAELDGAWDLRVHPGTLEDAYLALTGRLDAGEAA